MYQRQHTDYWCGPACLAMIIAWCGKGVSQKTLAKKAGTTLRGTRRAAMVRTLRAYGIGCRIEHASITRLEEVLKRGDPLLVEYKEPGSGDPHFAMITGSRGDRFVFHDPYHGEGFTLSKKDFAVRWLGYRTRVKGGWMVVCNKKAGRAGLL